MRSMAQQRDAVFGDQIQQRCCSPLTRAATAHRAPHLAASRAVSASPAAPRGGHTAGSDDQESLLPGGAAPPDIGMRRACVIGGHAGHRRIRSESLVGSLPRRTAPATMHRRRTDASRTRRRRPPTVMIGVVAGAAQAQRARVEAGATLAACGKTASSPDPDFTLDDSRSRPGGAEPSRRRASSSNCPSAFGPTGSPAR